MKKMSDEQMIAALLEGLPADDHIRRQRMTDGVNYLLGKIRAFDNPAQSAMLARYVVPLFCTTIYRKLSLSIPAQKLADEAFDFLYVALAMDENGLPHPVIPVDAVGNIVAQDAEVVMMEFYTEQFAQFLKTLE